MIRGEEKGWDKWQRQVRSGEAAQNRCGKGETGEE